jgi:hypothetical protein
MNNESILREILQLGCPDLAHCAATYKLYLKVTESLNCTASYHFSQKIAKLYLKVRNSEVDEEKIYMAIPSTKLITFQEINEYKKEFSEQSLTLAVCEPSSTILFYNLEDDFS